VSTQTTPVEWTQFECDGRTFEFVSIQTKRKTRPLGWPPHETSPGPWVPVVVVIVRNAGDVMGPCMDLPHGTRITIAHAVEAARLFWADLTR
jgi:hypothetical protein